MPKFTAEGSAIIDYLKRLNKSMCGVGNAIAASASACPPVPPSVSCTTLKCCTPTCDIVFKTTCITTEIITIPGVPGEPGESDPSDCNTDCCGKVTFGGGGTGTASTCTYEIGVTSEATTCTDASGATIECPTELIPDCEPDRTEYIPLPNPVCVAGDVEGECIENITKFVSISYDCFIQEDPVCHGYLINGVMVPCEEVTELPCPEYIILQNPDCPPDINLPPDCEYIELKDCPK